MAVARSPSPPKPENTPDMRWDTVRPCISRLSNACLILALQLEQISQEITEIARSAKISPVAKSQYYYLYRLAVEQIRTIDNLEPGKHSGEGTEIEHWLFVFSNRQYQARVTCLPRRPTKLPSVTIIPTRSCLRSI